MTTGIPLTQSTGVSTHTVVRSMIDSELMKVWNEGK